MLTGRKQSSILVSEARQIEQINEAKGEADAISLRAQATADAISRVGEAIAVGKGGKEAVSFNVAEKWVDAFSNVSKMKFIVKYSYS